MTTSKISLEFTPEELNALEDALFSKQYETELVLQKRPNKFSLGRVELLSNMSLRVKMAIQDL